MKSIIKAFLIILYPIFAFSQALEVEGTMKIAVMENDSMVQLVVVRKADGTLAVRDAATLRDSDSDPANEIQSVILVDDTLFISGANYVVLPPRGSTLDDAYDFGGAGTGRIIEADSGRVLITTSTPDSIALQVVNHSTGNALVATTTNSANAFSAILANTNSSSTLAPAIQGNTTGAGYGVLGHATAGSTAEAGVVGNNDRPDGGKGVMGTGFYGVVGQTGHSQGAGVMGENFDNITPIGNGIGVLGRGYYGVLGEDRYNGSVAGAFGVFANGALGATGAKTFQIDHPLDPENKFLRHFSIESNEILNVYRGTITFDSQGYAMVQLPAYFSAINTNISYQLTSVWAPMSLFISEKVNDQNQFVIGGGEAGMEVSWAVYAERNDRYCRMNPEERIVELEKQPQEKGKYLMPQLYHQGEDKAIFGKQSEKIDSKKRQRTE